MVAACMATEWVHHGLRTKYHDVVRTILLVTKLLQVYFFKHRVKTFLLVLVLVFIPWIRSVLRINLIFRNQRHDLANPIELETFQLLVQNLTNEGFLGLQDKGLIVTDDDKNEKLVNMDLVPYSDLERKRASLEHNYDFAFTYEGIEELTDKVLQIDGVMVVLRRGTLMTSESFQKPSNYEIVQEKRYEPRLDATIIAMRKTRMIRDDKNNASNTIPHRRLMFSQRKADAIKKLENVLLEPPRGASGKSKSYSKKLRYLPDLMEDSLEDYPRLVFIDVNGDMKYLIFTETEITDWLKENVNKGEYVVMKAEADVVEELINNNAIELVDELFMEFKRCRCCSSSMVGMTGSSFEAKGKMENQTSLKLYETNKIKQNAVTGLSRGQF
ncbi:hypothetical protein Tco_0367846 [Tanacetum coccineum]